MLSRPAFPAVLACLLACLGTLAQRLQRTWPERYCQWLPFHCRRHCRALLLLLLLMPPTLTSVWPGLCSFNKGWLDCHIEACKTQLGGKPLVIQEYNMPAAAGIPLRLELYDYVSRGKG